MTGFISSGNRPNRFLPDQENIKPLFRQNLGAGFFQNRDAFFQGLTGDGQRRRNFDASALTGLGHREGLIILWYTVGGRPAYYCTRSIIDKKFMKASLDGTTWEHPIWNVDDLYDRPNVVWAEGMFDCVSLKTLGYGAPAYFASEPVSDLADAKVKSWFKVVTLTLLFPFL
jgi:hypothetical protein